MEAKALDYGQIYTRDDGNIRKDTQLLEQLARHEITAEQAAAAIRALGRTR